MGDEFEEECLRVHNEYRRKHGAPPLVLDRQICNVAQQWAKNLAAWHKAQYSTGTGYGENIYAISGKVTGKMVVDIWYEGVKHYKYGTGFSAQTGNFTQIVWKSTTKLGVGCATNAHGWTFVVVNYSPQGNYQDQFTANVLPPGNYFPEEPVKPQSSPASDTKEITHQVQTEVKKLNTEPICTIVTESEKEQHYYHCKTCNIDTEEKAICRFCTKKCHKQHELVYFKSTKLFCFCGRKNGDTEVAKCVALPNDPCTFVTDKGRFQVQPWFRCNTCNMDEHKGACRFCVKLCHQDHEISEVKYSEFHCDCGLYGAFACKSPIPNKTCTSVTDKGEFKEQSWFRCKTCNMKENTGVCHVCVKVCHSQHEMDKANFGSFVCDCETISVFSCKACPTKEWCTFIMDKGEMKEQPWYRCKTCNMAEGMVICKICAKMCHAEHEIDETGIDSSICDCGSNTGGGCKASPNKVPKSAPPKAEPAPSPKVEASAVVKPIPKPIQEEFDQFSRDCLAAHNEYRKKHGSPPLVLTKWLCNVAQKWAEHCARIGCLQHSFDHPNDNENLYGTGAHKSTIRGRDSVDAFYSEIKYYTYGAGFSMQTGHFTAMIWKSCKELGVGIATSHNGWTYVVNSYSPKAHAGGSFSANVLPPQY